VRQALPGVAGALLLGLVLALRPAAADAADPGLEAARQRALLERAADADAALAAMEAQLRPARDAARDGASLIVAGEDDPQPSLEEAAAILEAAGPEAGAAAEALARLRGTAAAVRPGAVIPALAAPDDLAGIAGQLRDAATAAGPFLERRRAAERTLERLADALAALEADDLAAAERALDAARQARAMLAAWEPRPVTLPLWLRTTRQLIAAADDIVRAAEEGDPAAARAAGRRYAAAAEEAHRADVSLALTLSETGAGLTATPLRRLADQLAAVEDAKAAVASLRSILA
jgi:hypothetical protein